MASITASSMPPLEEPAKKDSEILTTIGEDSEVYQQVEKDFGNAQLNVEKLERFEKHSSWQKYSDGQKQMLSTHRTKQDPDFELNEKYLYHGTRANLQRLYEEGFDANLASKGCFGKGIYFSDNPGKCVKYSDNIILVARVLLGKVKEYEDGESNKTLVREPDKPTPCVGWRMYDSVKGKPTKFTEYVVYRGERALIEYIITYSKANKAPEVASDPISQPEEKEDAPSTTEEDGGSPPEEDEDDSSDTESESSDSSSTTTTSDEDEDDDGKDKKDKDTVRPATPSLFADSVIPYFKLPEGDFNLEEKKEKVKEITKEEDSTYVDTLLKETDEDLERAIFLFYAYKQVKEEEAKREAGEYVEEIEDKDDGSPIFTPMEPGYESDAWKKLSVDDKQAKLDAMTLQFLMITALQEIQRQVATDFLEKAKYNLDTAIVNYYTCWM